MTGCYNCIYAKFYGDEYEVVVLCGLGKCIDSDGYYEGECSDKKVKE